MTDGKRGQSVLTRVATACVAVVGLMMSLPCFRLRPFRPGAGSWARCLCLLGSRLLYSAARAGGLPAGRLELGRTFVAPLPGRALVARTYGRGHLGVAAQARPPEALE